MSAAMRLVVRKQAASWILIAHLNLRAFCGGVCGEHSAKINNLDLGAMQSRVTSNSLFLQSAPLIPETRFLQIIPIKFMPVRTAQGCLMTTLSEGKMLNKFGQMDQQVTRVLNDLDESSSESEDLEWEDDIDADVADLENSRDIDDSRKQRSLSGREVESVMRIEAPIDDIYMLLHSRGFISEKQKRPTPNDSVLSQEDHRIITWYRRISVGLLNYYTCCDNFLKVKAIVNYHLRWSAIHTLSKKHKSSSQQIIKKYGKNLVLMHDGKILTSFPSPEEIKQYQKGFLEIDPVPPELLIDVLYTKMKRRSREEKK